MAGQHEAYAGQWHVPFFLWPLFGLVWAVAPAKVGCIALAIYSLEPRAMSGPLRILVSNKKDIDVLSSISLSPSLASSRLSWETQKEALAPCNANGQSDFRPGHATPTPREAN